MVEKNIFLAYILCHIAFGVRFGISFSNTDDGFSNKFLDINLEENSSNQDLKECDDNITKYIHDNSTKNLEKRYMDYRDAYGLKFDPSTLRPHVYKIDGKLDFPKKKLNRKKTKSKVIDIKKNSTTKATLKKKKKKRKPKKKMQKIKLKPPPEYYEIVTPLTVMAPKGYPIANSTKTTENITKLQKYQKLVTSVKKKMLKLKNFTRTTTSTGKSNPETPARFLDVFEIVEFQNRPFCAATTPPLSRMTGSCFSLKNCAKLGGLALSECANGYGICCVFKMSCNGFTSQDVSYFESPGYPAPSLNPLSCSMAVLLKPKTQQLLLELEFFELLPPINGTCVTDKFVVLGQSINKRIPILCGINTGQHSK